MQLHYHTMLIMKILSRLVLVLPLLVSACSVTSPKMNEPLRGSPLNLDAKKQVNKSPRSDEVTLILTFSGGGTRAAAFSYGVLDELRRTPVIINNKERRLLDEVDLISSVSGGSFTSAYYGLFGDKIFTTFDKKFLKKRVQSDLIKLSLLSPKAWVRLLPGLFERSDLAAEYYNQFIFKKKTFADFRKDGPQIIINATDLSLGQGFAFTNYHFSWICSDLKSYPIARAVAASSAVPVLLSPITLRNHSSKCGTPPVLWSSKNKLDMDKKRYAQSLKIQDYRDENSYKYLHLVDGGIADNLGIRSIMDIVTYHRNNMWDLMNTFHMTKSKKFIFIVVNASSFKDNSIATRRVSPSTIKILDATTNIQFDKYNIETLDFLRDKFPQWRKQVIEGRCNKNSDADCKNIEFDLIEVNLRDLPSEERQAALNIPTSLELPAKTVDNLKKAGASLLRRSKTFQKVLLKLNKKE
ncbi:MAG TPA: patatin-like phospholipase family protein [Leucothrix sp.]|nr:patatin-like phospholipase family protein [Leucothrix sp.]